MAEDTFIDDRYDFRWKDVLYTGLRVFRRCQLAWPRYQAVAARQTICHSETRMKTFSIGPAVLCDMPMPNIIQAIGSNGR
ncbi:MAG: hypothetical protein IJL29_02425 [Prevotella sp.]|nr:hypothetical protein [Prevotella sp.]